MPKGRPAPKPMCKYGHECYRRNPEHFEEFDHPDNPNPSELGPWLDRPGSGQHPSRPIQGQPVRSTPESCIVASGAAQIHLPQVPAQQGVGPAIHSTPESCWQSFATAQQQPLQPQQQTNPFAHALRAQGGQPAPPSNLPVAQPVQQVRVQPPAGPPPAAIVQSGSSGAVHPRAPMLPTTPHLSQAAATAARPFNCGLTQPAPGLPQQPTLQQQQRQHQLPPQQLVQQPQLISHSILPQPPQQPPQQPQPQPLNAFARDMRGQGVAPFHALAAGGNRVRPAGDNSATSAAVPSSEDDDIAKAIAVTHISTF